LNPLQRFADLAGISIVDRMGVLLIRAEDAHAFIEACLKHSHAIIGIDGFDLHANGSIEPRNDAILNCTACITLDWAACLEQTAVAARNFMTAIQPLQVTHLEFALMAEREAKAARPA
jgi:hypothetical protein